MSRHDRHCCEDLIRLFDDLFAAQENTRLIKGGDEPLYLPADKLTTYHRVIFAHGYYASALHEIAHWCIAGKKRRQLQDYGYWYCPDGRDNGQQAEFERVEVKPQAIEWAFSIASGKAFRVSTDNLNGAEPNREAFAQAVKAQLAVYIQTGFPPRASTFLQALHNFYATAPLTEV